MTLSRFASFIGLALAVLAVLAGLAAGNFAQSRIRDLADLPLAVLGGRVDPGVGVGNVVRAGGPVVHD